MPYENYNNKNHDIYHPANLNVKQYLCNKLKVQARIKMEIAGLIMFIKEIESQIGIRTEILSKTDITKLINYYTKLSDGYKELGNEDEFKTCYTKKYYYQIYNLKFSNGENIKKDNNYTMFTLGTVFNEMNEKIYGCKDKDLQILAAYSFFLFLKNIKNFKDVDIDLNYIINVVNNTFKSKLNLDHFKNNDNYISNLQLNIWLGYHEIIQSPKPFIEANEMISNIENDNKERALQAILSDNFCNRYMQINNTQNLNYNRSI